MLFFFSNLILERHTGTHSTKENTVWPDEKRVCASRSEMPRKVAKDSHETHCASSPTNQSSPCNCTYFTILSWTIYHREQLFYGCSPCLWYTGFTRSSTHCWNKLSVESLEVSREYLQSFISRIQHWVTSPHQRHSFYTLHHPDSLTERVSTLRVCSSYFKQFFFCTLLYT